MGSDHSSKPASSSGSLGSSLEPDAYLGVNHNEKVSKVAIEVELTQKSSERIYEKFNQYKDSSYFDYVVYFFKDTPFLYHKQTIS